MHNYQDAKCLPILKNTIEAMGPDSVLLIDDLVLPNVGVHWRATQLDITMLSVLGAIERTIDMWQALFAQAGLKIVKVYKYTEDRDDSIIECVPI
jgi:demethylsterigmatocystin 6-O-methyltransferase